MESGEIQWIVVGIGVNVSTPATDFPEELRQIAGPVFPLNCPSATRNRLAAEIVNRLAVAGSQSSEKEILENYKQRMFILGTVVSVTGSGEPYEALALDIDDIGRLIVKRDNGELIPLSSGEIRIQVKV